MATPRYVRSTVTVARANAVNFRRPSRRSRSRSSTMLGYTPIDALLTNARSFKRPTSTLTRRPPAIAATARGKSSGSRTSLAK
jgi:hypothetical protein